MQRLALLVAFLLGSVSIIASAQGMGQLTPDASLRSAQRLNEMRNQNHALLQGARGILVTLIAPGSQAAAVDLQPGDIIVSYAGIPIDSTERLIEEVGRLTTTTASIAMVVVRNAERRAVALKSGRVGVELNNVYSMESSSKDASRPVDEGDDKPFVQLGGATGPVAISADGRFALTGAGNSMKLWDLVSRREVRSFDGHTKEVSSIVIHPNGKYAISGAGDGSLRLWELATGKTVYTIPTVAGVRVELPVNVALSPDGQQMATSAYKNVTLWDVGTGIRLRTFVFPDTSKGTGTGGPIAFSPDGKRVLTTDMFMGTGFLPKVIHVLRLWDATTGLHLRDLPGHAAIITSVKFSPDGRQLLSSSHDRTARLWDAETGKELYKLVADTAHGAIHSVAFNRDGKTALTAGGGGARLWDLNTGEILRSLLDVSSLALGVTPENAEPFAFAQGAEFIPNSPYALAIEQGELKIWDLATHKLADTISSNTHQTDHASQKALTAASFGPDGGHVLAGNNNLLSLWSVSKGKVLRVVEGAKYRPQDTFGLAPLVLSADRQKVLSTHFKELGHGVIELRDVDSGKVIQSFKGHTGVVAAASFSPNGQQVISIGGVRDTMWQGIPSAGIDSTIRLWDIATGENVRTFVAKKDALLTAAILSPDGNFVLSSSGPSEGSSLWDVAAGTLVRNLGSNGLSAPVFSPDGKYVLTGDLGAASGQYVHSAKLIDVGTGQVVRHFLGHKNFVSAVAFSPDGKQVLSGSHDNTVKIYELATGKEIHTLRGHGGQISTVSFSPDGRLVLSGSDDATARLWSVSTGKELIQMVTFKGGEWVAITPEGYFSASTHKAAKYLNIRKGMDVYGVDQFYDLFYRPDIVEAALGGQDISRMVAMTIAQATQFPPPVIEKIEVPRSSAADTVKVAYRIRSAGGGIGDVRVFHNGKLVQSDGVVHKVPDSLLGKKTSQVTGEVLASQLRGLMRQAAKDRSVGGMALSPPKPDLYEAVIEIDPLPGVNDISVLAFNAQNSIQSVARTTQFISTQLPVVPRLHILTVGVDDYKDKSAKLAFAVKDSLDFAARWKTQATPIYGEQKIFVEAMANGLASREGILAKINQMAARVKSTDHFILFIASHGVLLGDQYYMVTSDYDGMLHPSKLISAHEIVDASKRIKALSQLYILDTCHAGGMGGMVSGLYDARVSVLAKKMGLHIFASASSSEEAIDGFEGNGLFTHTLLSGLNNNMRVDANLDKSVSWIELGTYSKAQTRDLATRQKHKQDPLIINFGQDNPVYRLQ